MNYQLHGFFSDIGIFCRQHWCQIKWTTQSLMSSTFLLLFVFLHSHKWHGQAAFWFVGTKRIWLKKVQCTLSTQIRFYGNLFDLDFMACCPGCILLFATKTDLTGESTAVLRSTLSILLVSTYAGDHGLLYRYWSYCCTIPGQIQFWILIFCQHQCIKP